MDIRVDMIDLARAFNEARLAALHIDMQNKRDLKTEFAYGPVNDFAADLRMQSVENIWVAYTNRWQKNSYAMFQNFFAANGSKWQIHPDMRVPDDELVFEKASQSAFKGKFQRQSCPLNQHLEKQNKKTLIVDGVDAKICVTQTVAEALSQGYRVYIVLDATNCPEDQFDDYIDWFNRGNRPDEVGRVVFTTRAEVLKTLQFAKTPEFQKLMAA